MRRVSWFFLVLAICALVLSSCITDGGSNAEPASTSPEIAAADRSPSTAAPGPTATTTPAEKLSTTRPTSTTAPTATSAPPTMTLAPGAPSFEILPEHEDDYPAICTKERVLGIFQEFVERYNAGDAEGVVALMADENTEGKWYPGPENITDKIPFEGFWISSADGRAEPDGTWTHDDVREILQERFAAGEQLRLTRVIISPTWDRSTTGARADSDRNVEFGIEMEQWNETIQPHPIAGKGLIDCLEGKIAYLGAGPGQIGEHIGTVRR